MTAEDAQIAALRVLGWMANEDDLLPVFLGASGARIEDLKVRAGDPDFLASLIDFLLMDDAWVLRATETCGWPPERLVEIRAGLPGGDIPHWT